jgi:hypothetical protein
LAVLVVGLAVLLLAGCPGDEIEHYQVPKGERPKFGARPGQEQRTLAAMFPRDDATWFFKVMGPPTEVAKHKKEFDRFIRSVRFSGKEGAPTWEPPESWRPEPGQNFRFAVFHLGPKARPLELTVIKLGPEAGSIMPNFNRWREEVGLLPIVGADLDLVSREISSIEVDGVPATVVDVTGPGGKTKMGPPFAGRAGGPVADAPPKYTTPPGWKKLPDPGRFRLEAFQVTEGEEVAEVGITPLGGPARGLLDNVNRWRNDLGLERISEEDLQKEQGQIEVDGKSAPYVDLAGAEDARPRRRVLAVGVIRGNQVWYLTMKGPDAVVGKHKSEFEDFVKSVRFGSGQGGHHE